MRLKPKKYLGLLVVLVFIAFLFIIIGWGRNISSLVLYAKENKFVLEFNVLKKDEKSFSKVLENLSIPQSVASNVGFELDATSSAKLTYLTPIRADLGFSDQTLFFSGEMSRSPFFSGTAPETLKVPKSFNLAVFAPNVSQFIITRYSFPSEFVRWLEKNFNGESGQYLVIFGSNADFALLVKNDKVDLSSLKDIQFVKDLELRYKEEIEANINFHFLRLPEVQEGRELTAAFFYIDDWFVFSSSREAAFEFAKVYKTQGSSIDFPGGKTNGNVTFALLFNNSRDNPINQNFNKLLFTDTGFADSKAAGIAKTLEKVENLTFILKTFEFSGLINIK